MSHIRVAVRIRPDEPQLHNAQQLPSLEPPCIRLDGGNDSSAGGNDGHKGSEGTTISISNKKDTHQFKFDQVFEPHVTQEEVYHSVKDLVEDSLDGFNVSIFAFGMTGSGKTHTILGSPQMPGIVPRAVHHVFSELRARANKSKNVVSMVSLTFVELYNNTLYDLLATNPSEQSHQEGLKIHEHPTLGIQIKGSNTIRTPVSSAEEALSLIARGNKMRATATTNLNERSSRSHSVITLEIFSKNLPDGKAISTNANANANANGKDSTSHSVEETDVVSNNNTNKGKTNNAEGDLGLVRMGKINLIDLAGSENVKVSGAEGQTLTEAKQINKALAVLGDVLNSLSKFYMDQKQAASGGGNVGGSIDAVGNAQPPLPPHSLPHIPYRNSKLTMLLKDSLGGNAKTMMIATIRSSGSFYQQSLTALRYAARARHIRCNPVLNIGTTDTADADSSSMQKVLGEVSRLKLQLDARTVEYNNLKARLDQLERARKNSTAAELAKKGEEKALADAYRKQIEELKIKSEAERQQLAEHLRGVIHSHEGQLAAREREFESRLERQLSTQKQRAELTHADLQKSLAEKDTHIAQLEEEVEQLKQNLKIQIDRAAEAELSAGDRVQFVDALQKLSVSRTKHKKRAEELHEACVTLKSSLEVEKNNLQTAETTIETHKREIDTLTKTLKEQEKLMTSAVKRLKELDSHNTMLDGRVKELTEALDLTSNELNTLKAERLEEQEKRNAIGDASDNEGGAVGVTESIEPPVQVQDRVTEVTEADSRITSNLPADKDKDKAIEIEYALNVQQLQNDIDTRDNEIALLKSNIVNLETGNAEREMALTDQLRMHAASLAEERKRRQEVELALADAKKELEETKLSFDKKIPITALVPVAGSGSGSVSVSQAPTSQSLTTATITTNATTTTAAATATTTTAAAATKEEVPTTNSLSSPVLPQALSQGSTQSSNTIATTTTATTATTATTNTPASYENMIMSPTTENIQLKQKIGKLMSQESALFSALEFRLKDLEEAKTKLVKLSSNVAAGTYSMSHEARLEEIQYLEERLEASELANIALEEDLRLSRTKAIELQLLLDQKTKQAEMAEKAAKDTLDELHRTRQEQGLVLRKAVSLVKKHVEDGQERRSIELNNELAAITSEVCAEDSLESIETIDDDDEGEGVVEEEEALTETHTSEI